MILTIKINFILIALSIFLFNLITEASLSTISELKSSLTNTWKHHCSKSLLRSHRLLLRKTHSIKKPVIIFYNYENNDKIEVNLKLNSTIWTFWNMYPRFNIKQNTTLNSERDNATWKIELIKEDNKTRNLFKFQKLNKTECGLFNCLKDFKKMKKKRVTTQSEKLYTNIFWDAHAKNKTIFYNMMNKTNNSYILSRHKAIKKLDQLLSIKGLIREERKDFVKYWKRTLLKKNYIQLSFVENNTLQSIANLTVNPSPEKILRVFIVLKPVIQLSKSMKELVDKDILLETEKKEIENPIKRENLKGLVVEYGGIILH